MTATERGDTGSNKLFAVFMLVLSLLIFLAVLRSEREHGGVESRSEPGSRE